MNVRIIPRLDIKGPNLVKGIHLEGLRVLGKPERFARHYYENGADELLYMDVVASLYQRNNLLDIVTRTSREVFIPLTVGGGIRTLDDINQVLRAGGDKVSLNTAAVANPSFIEEAAQRFGSSTIVVSIEAIRQPDGHYEAYTDNGRESTGLDAVEWAKRVVDLGAGEILLTSVDREGTGKGFDLELTRAVAGAVPIPVIAAGGAGNLDHVADVIHDGQADAVCIASMLHYRFLRSHAPDDDFSTEGNVEYLKNQRGFSKVEDHTLAEIKAQLSDRGIPCRHELAELTDV
jgi:imidazole glycerol-phosphate synthase subunit HisF